MNKTQAILNYLETHTGITSMQAIEMFGATRLSAIIFNLKRRGYDITTVDRVAKDRFDNTCRFVEYRLVK